MFCIQDAYISREQKGVYIKGVNGTKCVEGSTCCRWGSCVVQKVTAVEEVC